MRGNHPSINLYSSDGSHPSAAGTYLAACTFYAALYQKSPVGASFTSSLSAQDAVNIQAAAAAVYFDDLDIWQVSPNTEYTTADFSFDNSSLAVGFTNLSTQADTYAWQFGDGNSSNDINPTNTYAGTGIYSVELISTSSCDADTVQYDVDLSTLSLNNQNLENIKVEMIQRGKYAITGFETVNDLKVFSLEGKNIAAEFSVDDKLVVNFNAVNATRYFVVIVQGNKLHQFALPVVVD